MLLEKSRRKRSARRAVRSSLGLLVGLVTAAGFARFSGVADAIERLAALHRLDRINSTRQNDQFRLFIFHGDFLLSFEVFFPARSSRGAKRTRKNPVATQCGHFPARWISW